jgi:hypothetical protein
MQCPLHLAGTPVIAAKFHSNKTAPRSPVFHLIFNSALPTCFQENAIRPLIQQ